MISGCIGVKLSIMCDQMSTPDVPVNGDCALYEATG
jgi:hypothetical protein